MMLPLIGLIGGAAFLFLSPLNGLVAWSFLAPVFDTVVILKIGDLIPQLTFNRIFLFSLLVLYFFSKRQENMVAPPEKGRLEKLMLLFAIIFIIEIYLHYRPKDGTRNMIGFFEGFIGPFILFMMARYYVRTWRSVDKIFNALLAMGFFLALIGIYEQITRVDLLNFTPLVEDIPEGLTGLREEEYWVRSNGTFLTPESYGITLAMIFFIGLYKLKTVRFAQGDPLFRRSLLIGILIVLSGGIFCSMFRNIWLGVLAGLFVAVWARPGKKAGAISLIVVVFLSITLLGKLGGTFSSERFLLKETMYSRIGAYKIAFQAFRQNPLFGIGYNEFEQYAKNYQEDMAYMDVIAAKQAHNTFLSVLAENGIIGFIPFILFWIAVIRGAADLYRKAEHEREKQLSIMLLSVAAALITPWFFERTGYYAPLNNVFFLIFGVVAGILHWEHRPVQVVQKTAGTAYPLGRLAASSGNARKF